MKFSYNWLSELLDGALPGPAELTRLITMKTAECEGVEAFAPALAHAVAARVLEVTPIEGSHNVQARIDAGPVHGVKQVVCGAPNCRAGLVTAYLPAGAEIDGRVISKVTISGVESDGMLASAAELSINRDHSGILEIDIEPGSPLPGLAADHVIEVDNKSLTHRPDLWGHYGLAREIAAITGAKLKDPVKASLLPAGEPLYAVEIEDHSLSPRYSALVFENVTVQPSPLWLQARLEAAGMNAINNIVDVTNYIGAELAEPMHAFDADKLQGNTIYVRRAKSGEPYDALNGESYTLEPRHLVIADSGGAIALAGVIGGAGSAINSETTRIVLESANFDAACIRKTSAEMKLRTDASMRFEKAQDPKNTVRALARAIALFEIVSPGIRLHGGMIDNFKAPPAPAPITLPMEWLIRKLGRPIEAAEVRAILESLEFGVAESAPGVFEVTVPSWRATKDVTIKDDLLEEVGRMVGYSSIPPEPPLKPVQRPWVNHERLFHHDLRQKVAAQGFTETYNYSFVSEAMAARFGFTPDQHVHVLNPISVEQSLMRISLLPGIHRNIVDNARYSDEFRLFEIGNEIHKRQSNELPHEVPHLMAAIHTKADGSAAYYELKRLAECLMPGCEAAPASSLGYEHSARAAAITWRGREAGRIFELHPSLVESGRASVLDANLAVLFELGPAPKRYQPLRRFPSSSFDLSVVAGLRELTGDLGGRIRAAAGANCDSVEFLYSYQGHPLPDDKQSLSYRITVSAPDHTLSNEELTGIRAAIIEALKAAGYELRG
ncbi:MAG: phenylalanine--tRNA ligase subunit beta [Bryobacteraceae bacterium]|nr:phenylalanine--tRNA ligase subunit beta [Bryobacteraceae bacterium]